MRFYPFLSAYHQISYFSLISKYIIYWIKIIIFLKQDLLFKSYLFLVLQLIAYRYIMR